MRHIITDIEGTTSSVSFVFEVLFPYFRAHFRDFFDKNHPNQGLPDIIAAVQDTVLLEQKHSIDQEAAIETLITWSIEDRKHPALKQVQGLVWRSGYESGAIRGHVYPDVAPALARWQAAGLCLSVYSSGSVQAQQLLFAYSEAGDLRPFFSHYFDTGIGPKRAAESYRRMAETLGGRPTDMLFLSDVVAELDAAREAGLQTVQLLRPGTEAGSTHPVCPDFNAIDQYL